MKSNKGKPRTRMASAAARKRAGKRLAAYRAAQKRGLSGKSAARSAVRKVPFTSSERSRGAKL